MNRPESALGLPVELSRLAEIRSIVAQHGRACGLTDVAVADLVLIANELATNAIRHGGGAGQMWLWCTAEGAVCQVSDQGPGMAPDGGIGVVKASPQAVTGRGIWMVRQLCCRVDFATGAKGTTVTAVVARVGSPNASPDTRRA